MKKLLTFALCLAAATALAQENYVSQVWVADRGDGTYRNPILYADYSDPDVCRAGKDYYMTSSSFGCLPGLQILHSKDLVNWTIAGAAIPYGMEPYATPEVPWHGNGVWAPCIRYHNEEFYIYWGNPDLGAFVVKARDARGPWSEPVLVKAGKGIIDTSPLWDDDGRVYLVHGLAGSRADVKSMLLVCELNAEGTRAITPSRIVFDGHDAHPTIEGPKFHKRDGWYWIFAPAGGVATGWQVAMRSRSPWGPYEDRVVMRQGSTAVNGPHQGAWVETPGGESWFFHFQDVGAYGRIVHLQPMQWVGGWPVIGDDKDGDGCGEPVTSHRKPDVGRSYPICTPRESDEFDGLTLGLQWQWHANINENWAYCGGPEKSYVRLYSYAVPEGHKNLFDVPNLLLQKTPADTFTATMKLTFRPDPRYRGERTGLLVMGLDYGLLALENTAHGLVLSQVECKDADRGTPERVVASVGLKEATVWLRVHFDTQAKCVFSYSVDGKKYTSLGTPFAARQGKWIGAKVGTFCTRPAEKRNDGGCAEIDWFRITK